MKTDDEIVEACLAVYNDEANQMNSPREDIIAMLTTARPLIAEQMAERVIAELKKCPPPESCTPREHLAFSIGIRSCIEALQPK